MTDNGIIKALEGEIHLAEYADNDFADNVSIALLKDTLDLINRQKAEIERLQKEVGLVSIQFQDMQERQEESQAEIEGLKEESLILKQFINGEWVDCKEIQEALSIDFATGLKRFDFSRTAEWCPAPLCGQKITTKFRLSDNKAIKEFAEKLKEKDGYYNHIFDDCAGLLVADDYIKGRHEKSREIRKTIDNLVKEMVGENNGEM